MPWECYRSPARVTNWVEVITGARLPHTRARYDDGQFPREVGMTEPYQAGPGEDPVPQRAVEPYAEPVPNRAQDPYLPPAPQRAQESYLPPAPFPEPTGAFAPALDKAPDTHLDALYRAPQEPLAPAQPPAPEAPPAALYRAAEQPLTTAQPSAPQDHLADLYRAPEQQLAPAPDQAPVQHLAPASQAAVQEAPGARRAEPEPVADEPGDVVSFPGAVGWTIAGTIIPGLGFLKARRWFDGVMTLIFFVFVLAIIGYLVYEPAFAKALMTSPITLLGIAVLCAILGIMIIGIILATYISLRPHVVTRGQRIAGGVLVFVLSFVVCVPLAVGAGYTLSQAGLIK